MYKHLLVICGQTGTGKTKLAISLCKKLNAEIISADSRQVYKGMNIGTGKDLWENDKCQMTNVKLDTKTICLYETEGVKVWGYDLVEPTDDFSVSDFSKIANQIAGNIWSRGKLPIVVGGTGFYIKALVDGIDTSSISPDRKLRAKLESKNAQELLDDLLNIDPARANSMNDSDFKNPRRLIRAIEIAYQVSSIKYQVSSNNKINCDSVMLIGLTAPKHILYKRIEGRVYKRINEGFEKEVEDLVNNGVDWKCKSMQGMGYRQYEDYYKKKITREEFINAWVLAEQKYSKRQLTWFKKDKRINWFDISSADYRSKVEKIIESWYHDDSSK